MMSVRRQRKPIREEDRDMPFYDDEDSGGYRGAGYREGGYQGGGSRAAARHHQPPLHTEKLVTDRKIFFLDLKENDRGRVVKITEDVRGRRDTIMLPVEMLRDFIEALQRIEDADGGTGPAPAADEPQGGE
jgi:hypothetical protein